MKTLKPTSFHVASGMSPIRYVMPYPTSHIADVYMETECLIHPMKPLV